MERFSGLSWRGIVDIEADSLALRDGVGSSADIRDLFLAVSRVAGVRTAAVPIGGGFQHETLTWNDEDGGEPTDAQVPGLASLLRWLDAERPVEKK